MSVYTYPQKPGWKNHPVYLALFANPVVVRDLRAQMRGTKSYWYQGAYLLLLGILSIVGYNMATRQLINGMDRDVVAAQEQLRQFYHFLFTTLATLIALIAPALTASSVVGERVRLSFDLLITTPITAFELLVGKLLSSIAFLGLLLALSLPASALCILLGGASIGDVFQIYTLLAMSGLVLSAIGLFFSCTTKTPLLAIVWTYVAVVGYLAITYYFLLMSINMSGNPNDAMGKGYLLTAMGALNPFGAISQATRQPINAFGLSIPSLVLILPLAVTLIATLFTASAYRLGMHGGGKAGILRRLVLCLTAFVAFSFLQIFPHTDYAGRQNAFKDDYLNILIMFFTLAIPFLPGLFVPLNGDEGLPGATEEGSTPNAGRYRVGLAFRPLHAGSLPYFHLWLLVVGGGLLLGGATLIGTDTLLWENVSVLLCGLLYLSSLGFLFWGLARLASRMTKNLSAARGLAFALFLVVLGFPAMFLSMSSAPWQENPLSALWLLYPVLATLHEATRIEHIPALLLSSGLAYVIGAVITFFGRKK